MSESSRKLLPILIGMLLTIVFLVGLGYLAAQRKATTLVNPPQLTIVRPVDEAATDSPLVIGFRSAETIALQPSGWGYRALHLHAWVDDVQHMPGAADLTATADGYQWVLSAVGRGVHRIHLGWADQAHRPLTRGGSDSVTVTVR